MGQFQTGITAMISIYELLIFMVGFEFIGSVGVVPVVLLCC